MDARGVPGQKTLSQIGVSAHVQYLRLIYNSSTGAANELSSALPDDSYGIGKAVAWY